MFALTPPRMLENVSVPSFAWINIRVEEIYPWSLKIDHNMASFAHRPLMVWSVGIYAERGRASATDEMSLTWDIVGRLGFCVSAWLQQERELCVENAKLKECPLSSIASRHGSLKTDLNTYISSFFLKISGKVILELSSGIFTAMSSLPITNKHLSSLKTKLLFSCLFNQQMWGLDCHHLVNNDASGIGGTLLTYCS